MVPGGTVPRLALCPCPDRCRAPALDCGLGPRRVGKRQCLTPTAARESLHGEVESLAQEAIHPDMLAWLFIRELTRLQDVTLMDMAPSDVQDRIQTVVAEFERDGEYILSTRNGPIDHSRAVRELARFLTGD